MNSMYVVMYFLKIWRMPIWEHLINSLKTRREMKLEDKATLMVATWFYFFNKSFETNTQNDNIC